MTEYAYDLNPVQHIVADAVGEPGNRTFFLQGRAGPALVSLVLEKQEVANLAISILQLLEELEEKFPELTPAASSNSDLIPESPVEPLFRVGQLIVGYDEEDDMIWLIAKALIISESGTALDPEDDEVPSVRFVATRQQMRALSEHALETVARGRPTCPLCGQPINRDGHFCPRSDGQAMPIVF
ncbi:MAG: DUF3090 domain-containing protein [Chloroflexota bacterium]|nr:DUF3090 domain-containing protein [Chloroflexota bacterium]